MKHTIAVAVGVFLSQSAVLGQAVELVLARVKQERAPFIDTVRELVSIESGSRDIDGLNRISEVIANRLRALGGDVQFVAPANDARFEDTPPQIGRMVLARFKGTGTRNILLLAHMDTVYDKGMGAKQPFRIDGDRAYGLGIQDNKSGVAVILHAVAVLNALNIRNYGTMTVLINGDEEIGSPGSRGVITRLGREHDVVFSCEPGNLREIDEVALATMGVGFVTLRVTGRASHSGVAPEQGRNALYELAHQIMQMRDLSDPTVGLKMNWTVASAGTARNVIPASAQATADVRVQRVSDLDVVERRIRERASNTLVPDTKVDIVMERRRPPLELTPGSRALGDHAKRVYAELGKTLAVALEGTAATDAAFAALESRAAAMEGFGPLGFGLHSGYAEYVFLSSIEPRLYLLSRMIIDVASGKASVP